MLLKDTTNVEASSETPNETSALARTSAENEGHTTNVPEFSSLFQQLGYSSGSSSWLTPEEWLDEDTGDLGFQILADDEIISSK